MNKNRTIQLIPAFLLIIVFNSIVESKKAFAGSINAPLYVNVFKYDLVCNGDKTGLIDLEVSGGTRPYKFLWSNGAATEDISGLDAGNYEVIVSDAAGKSVEKSVTINEPAAININAVVKHSIYNESNGEVELSVSGGVGSYSYLWSDNSEEKILSNIEQGIYAVKVTDAHNCFETTLFRVAAVKPLNVEALAFPLLCNNDNTGLIDVTVSGGIAPYHFYWSNGNQSEDISGLSAGFYSVKVYDASGQVVFKEIQISQPESISIMANVTDETAMNAADGKIELLISGGKAPYIINWANDFSGEMIQNLSSGIYHVEVTDKNYCTASHEALVSSEAEYLQAPSIVSNSLSAVSQNNFNESGIKVFPVPAGNMLHIESADRNEAVKQVIIYSVEGKIMINSFVNASSVNLNLEKIQMGNYIIKIVKDKTTIIRLFSKEV